MSDAPQTVYIGLGSNLDNPLQQVATAFDELQRLPHSRLTARSSLYRSDPLGPQDQPEYVNAVAELHTSLQPLQLLDALQAIEQAHRRVRERHWGPRTLDLDILLYGDLVSDLPRLQVPHPQMHLRSFVLVPLHQIAPELQVPGLGSLSDLLAQCESLGLQRLAD